MEKIKLVVILIVCFAFFGFILGDASAEEIKLTILGGVYHMITSPVLPENPDPQVTLADYLGPYDETQWRFFRYNPARGDYDELKSSDWNPIEDDFYFGRGYWIISSGTKTIDIQGDPTGVNQITLRSGQDGWNQIGNIYLQDFMIGIFPNCNLWVIPKSGGTWYQLNDPDNPYTHVTLQEYTGGTSYIDIADEPGEMLETGKAYWLKNKWTEEVVLSFDPAGLTQVASSNSIDLPGEDFLARVAQQEAPPDPPAGLESSSSVSGSSSGGCFIATAAYGDYDHPMVQLMREFRDRYLLANSLGRTFVELYYRYSPALARVVADSKPRKILIRSALMPVVATSALVCQMNVYGLLIVLAFPFLGCFVSLRRRKGAWGKCKLKFSGKMTEEKIRE